VKQDRKPARKTEKKSDDGGIRTALIAAVTAIIVGVLSAGVTYLTTGTTLRGDEAAQQREALRTACLDGLKSQSGEISQLTNMFNDLVILKDLGQFQKDTDKYNSLQDAGQDAELYLDAPDSVRSEVKGYAETVNNAAVPALLRLAAVPASFRDLSPEATSAEEAINKAQEDISQIGAACKTALN
jgi:hypothetical protein